MPARPAASKMPSLNARLAAAFCVATCLALPAAAQPYTSGYVQVAAGSGFTCALRHDGQLWCWGANNFGQLGVGNTAPSFVPVQANSTAAGFGSNNIAAISASMVDVCALNNAGRAFCWGGNFYGSVGDGTVDTRQNPVRVEVIGTGVQTISSGVHSTCAIDAGNRSWCWGRNDDGRLGDGSTDDQVLPVPVSTVTAGFGAGNIAAIASRGSHSCAINAAGRAFCWGVNGAGQLGDNTTDDSAVPIPVDTSPSGFGTRNIAQIAVGLEHSCALNLGGRAFCWGRNGSGQLGAGISANVSSTIPIATATTASGFGTRNIARIAAGPNSTCALNSAGRAFCWGRNTDGQVGDGTISNRNAPVQVSGLGTGLRDISLGGNHTCAIDAAGDVWCWGNNLNGQLGTGDTTASALPVRVQGLP